jgi:MATE family multidrug resistance protein
MSAMSTAVVREISQTIRLAVPVVVGQWAAVAMGFVDTVMVGRVSAEALAAVAVGGSLWATVMLFLTGVVMALPPTLAQARGARRLDRCSSAGWQTFWIGQGLAVLGIAALMGAGSLLRTVDVEQSIVPLAIAYLRAIAVGLPAFAGYQALRFFNEGFAQTRPAMIFGLVGLGANVILNYALIFGAFGAPALGVVGCGYATAAVFWLQFLGLAVYTLRTRRYESLELWRVVAPRVAEIKRLLDLGLPIGVAIFVEASLFSGVALLVGRLGAETVAGHQVAVNFAALTFMMPLGIGMAATVRVGEGVGKADPAAARRAGLVGIGLAVAVQSLSALVMATQPEWIARIYSADPGVIKAASGLLLLAALFQLPDGLQVSSAGALRGIKDTRVPMVLTLVAYWGIGLPLAWFLGVHMGLGAQGTWIGLIAGLATAGVLLCARFLRLSRSAVARSTG